MNPNPQNISPPGIEPSAGTDYLAVDVPELVSFNLEVATIGSRFVAMAVDLAVRTFATLGLVYAYYHLVETILPALGVKRSLNVDDILLVVFLIVGVLFWFGYFVLFEVMQHGRTLGKRLMKLRVVTDTGGPVGWTESLIRNVLRVVDAFPFFYGVGFLTMVLNRRSQRVGDLAAGTIVIREGTVRKHAPVPMNALRVPAVPEIPLPERVPLSARGHDILTSFFARYWEFSDDGRRNLAKALILYLWPEHIETLSMYDPEAVLWNYVRNRQNGA